MHVLLCELKTSYLPSFCTTVMSCEPTHQGGLELSILNGSESADADVVLHRLFQTYILWPVFA
jgi:hypothetical protein